MAWLRELVDTGLSPSDLAERLTLGGLEVEDVVERGLADRVVVGRVIAVEPHPNADRLRVTKIDVGGGSPIQVVTNVVGVREGNVLGVALPGARLGDTEIAVTELRGVRSEGMFVSEKTAGLSDVDDDLLRFDRTAKPGEPAGEAAGFRDTVLEIGVTPNRGDCLSVLGIAREVATLTGARLRAPRGRRVEERHADAPGISIADPALCSRYLGRVIGGVRLAPSPTFVRARLEASGVRAINNVVDVTNWVLLERGQPLHAFDLREVTDRRIEIRRAREIDRFTTLDEIERPLVSDDLLIFDSRRPLALAGIMGGLHSAIRDDTTDLLLEVAHFDAVGIRRTARRLGLHTESSHRFERCVDPAGLDLAMELATRLLARWARGEAGPVAGAGAPLPRPAAVRVRVSRVNRLLGTDLAKGEISRTLRAVSASVRRDGGDAWACEPPTWRSDLEREADFIEEIARCVGYDRIPETRPRTEIDAAPVTKPQRAVVDARTALLAQGLHEMVTFRFLRPDWNRAFPGLGDADAAPVALRNPLSEDGGELRRSLVPNLLAVAARNRNHGALGVRGFEIGPVFRRAGDGSVAQSARLGVVLDGRRRAPAPGLPDEEESFQHAKGVVEALLEALRVPEPRWEREDLPEWLHPGTSARVMADGVAIGTVGAVHPTLAAGFDLDGPTWAVELDFDALVAASVESIRVTPLPRFPAVTRDLAVVADEDFPAGRVLDHVRADPSLSIEEVRLFDVYRGQPIPEGKKSLAYAIRYRSADRTLTDDEVGALHERLVASLAALGVEPRVGVG